MYFGITEKGEEERTESNGRQIKKERETEGNTNIKENEETEAKARLYICFCSVGMPGGGLTGERCLPGGNRRRALHTSNRAVLSLRKYKENHRHHSMHFYNFFLFLFLFRII